MSNWSAQIVAQWRAVIVVVVLLCGAGALAATSLPVSIFPQVDFPRIVLELDDGVIPADQMMAAVTQPVVEGLTGLPGVAHTRSTTTRGSSEVNLYFAWGTDMPGALQLVNGKLAQVLTTLPSTVTLKRLDRMTFAVFPVLGYCLTSATENPMSLRDLALYTVKPRLSRLDGVARVSVDGGQQREVQVMLDPDRLAARNLGSDQVVTAIRNANVINSPGLMDDDHRLVLTLVSGLARDPQQLAHTLVSVANGTPTYVSDVGAVSVGPEPVHTIVRSQDGPAVLVGLLRQSDANTVKVADEAHRELAGIKASLPSGVTMTPYYDQSLLITASMQSVRDAILLGLGLSALVLFFFLGDLGSTLVAALVIPVTVLITFVFMHLLGMGFDLMTLGGVAASIGLVIDDAIVVVESIHSRDGPNAVESALREIALPILGSTMTPVVVFLPTVLLTGVTGVFFRALAVTMSVALLTSLVLALSFTPALSRRLIRSGRKSSDGGALLRPLLRSYEAVLSLALRLRWLLVLASFGLLAGSWFLYQSLPSDFLPEFDESAFVLDYRSPPGSSLAETDRALREVEAQMKSIPDIEGFARRTGLQQGGDITEPNQGDYLVKLRPGHKTPTDDVQSDLRKFIEAHEPTLEVEFSGILGDLIGDLTSAPEPIVVKLFGPDPRVLEKTAQSVADTVSKVPHVVDVKNGIVVSGPAVTYRVDPLRCARFSLSASDVSQAVAVAVEGQLASTMLQQGHVLNVRVRFPPVPDLGDLPIHSPNGLVRLSQIADVERDPGQTELNREGLRPVLEVTGRLEAGDLGTGMAAIRQKLSTLHLPDGVTLEYGGLYEQQQSSFHELLLVMGLAASLVLVVLLIEFRNFDHPLAILWGSVLATGGALAALRLTGMHFNVISFLGTIMVLGIVAKNGILMLDAVDSHLKSGDDLRTALINSGRRRFRPVLMTSLTAALGMLPLALGMGAGAELLQPLAVAVIGGLVISLFLSLVITPCTLAVLRGNR